jgi:hypothetical protein
MFYFHVSESERRLMVQVGHDLQVNYRVSQISQASLVQHTSLIMISATGLLPCRWWLQVSSTRTVHRTSPILQIMLPVCPRCQCAPGALPGSTWQGSLRTREIAGHLRTRVAAHGEPRPNDAAGLGGGELLEEGLLLKFALEGGIRRACWPGAAARQGHCGELTLVG